MVAKKGRRDSSDSSPSVEVGEIDTSSPFQSVKDAVTLFGREAAFSAEKQPLIRKPSPQSAEKVLSRDTANTVTEAAKSLIKEAKPETVSVSSSDDAQGLDLEQYGMVCKELDTAKQELRKIRQVSNEVSDTKTVALAREEEAKEVTKVCSEKIEFLRKEIAAVNESVEQTKLACSQSRKEQTEIFSDKEIQRQSYKAGMEESAKKLLALKNEFDPEFAKILKRS
ncbi:hypothetical protein Bca52824_057661 [Brassica carinata]|uniref:Uncharacterized protein n=1 Tax=Brassica carinata TaxID=52824 RepID=A0A8X7UGE7_BRACI|nr:hypothetical protein Bca52824_057661 [Brassica carinata]